MELGVKNRVKNEVPNIVEFHRSTHQTRWTNKNVYNIFTHIQQQKYDIDAMVFSCLPKKKESKMKNKQNNKNAALVNK